MRTDCRGFFEKDQANFFNFPSQSINFGVVKGRKRGSKRDPEGELQAAAMGAGGWGSRVMADASASMMIGSATGSKPRAISIRSPSRSSSLQGTS